MESVLPGDLGDDDRLFNTDGPWQMQTKLLWDLLREYRYVDGFRRAAEVLGDHCAEHRADVDALAVPILFCYRQWIELRLKELWRQGSRLHGRSAGPLLTHDLNALWRRVRPLIERTWPDGNRDQLDHAERVLAELAAFDGRQGTGFRYAFDKAGRESLPDDLQINLRDVRVVMSKVAVLLDGAAEGVAVMLEHEADMQAEYGNDF